MISVMSFSVCCLFVKTTCGEGRLKKVVSTSVSILMIFVCALPLFQIINSPIQFPEKIDCGGAEYTSNGAFVSAGEIVCSDIKNIVMTKHGVEAEVEIDLDVTDITSVGIAEVRVAVPTGNKEKIKATVASLVTCDNIKILYFEEKNDAIYRNDQKADS